MPTRLPDRCRPDSIREFRRAARQRFQDGLALAAAGRRTGAIYLWGYTAEMSLKAAYFRVIGFPANRTITPANLRAAAASAPPLGFVWAGNLHHVESWGRLLVRTRARISGFAYPAATFGDEVLARSGLLQRLWTEVLRYHENLAYSHEVEQVHEIANWFLLNALQL